MEFTPARTGERTVSTGWLDLVSPWDGELETARRVIVCGGRRYGERHPELALIHRVIASIHDGATVVHGAARGADVRAGEAALRRGLWVEAHPADWFRYGNAAGPIRNQEMINAGADVVIAFPGGRGTADLCRRAEAAGIPVLRVGGSS